ncbi:hypothetical protein HYALB_00013525 [Hymenoscyphus albidus]|uniref:2EXR domain-containing protein n=1 Tax=Hymenoscyphus albidus TaxID=595503 RepID=A0A9N9LUU0_9HELO|nr:hypothetical protein HYALB_00013525 [Hymenoscyphus albidus]
MDPDPSILLPDQPDSSVAHVAPNFSGFRTLPPEIRNKIWKSALLPRLITITPILSQEDATCEVKVETQRVELVCVCQESRAEVLKHYKHVRFNGDNGATTLINWSWDTVFLHLPDESVDVDNTITFLGDTFQLVQTLAIRMRTHVFWGFPEFLRQARHLQSLIFVDEPERDPLPQNVNGHLYLMDLGSLGFVRGCNVDPYGEYRFFQEDIWTTLLECYQDERFGLRYWEMPQKTISWVKDLNNIGECLLLPVT